VCGLIAMLSRRPQGFNYSDMDMYENMLLVDSIRGKDSTGVFTRFRNGDVRVIKHGSHPYNLFRTNEWRDFKQQVTQRGKFVVGHNRAATRGSVNTDNAHPFVEDHIILAHNGTLKEQKNLTDEKTEVDSHAIAHALAKNNYAEVLPQINGAFALIWYDTVAEKLYATRNTERPLNLCVSDDILFLASEAWMAGILAARNHHKVTASIEIEPGEIFVFGGDGKWEVEKFDLNAKKSDLYSDWEDHVRRNLAMGGDGDSAPFDGGQPVTPVIQDQRTKVLHHIFPKTNSTTTPSTSCALTQSGGTQTRTEPSDEEMAQARSTSIQRFNENFQQGNLILFKIHQTTRMVNNRFKFNGTVYTPELERMDVTGFLPFNVTPNELGVWLDTLCVGNVQFTTLTQGGWTIHMKDVKKATYTAIHEKEVPIMLWDFAKNHCECDVCQRPIEAWEKAFTSIKTGGEVVPKKERPINTLIVTCPDCITTKIEKEEYRARYVTKYKLAKDSILKARAAAASRAASVQDGEPVSQDLSPTHARLLGLPGPSTLQ
jgi:hypothetical protein